MDYIERDPLPEICACCADRLACLARDEGEWCCEECENLLARFFLPPMKAAFQISQTCPAKTFEER